MFIKSVFFMLICFFLFSMPSSAGLPPLIPRKILFGNPSRLMPRISPDEKKIAYLAPENGVLNIWVEINGKAHAITDERKRAIRNYYWQYDSNHILYLQDQDGDENFHIYQIDILSEKIRDLTPFPGVKAYCMRLNHKMPDILLCQMNKRDARYFDVYRINLKDASIELDTENPGDVDVNVDNPEGWVADNNNCVRLAKAINPDGSGEIRTRENNKSKWRTVMKWGHEESFVKIIGFSEDNNEFYILSSIGSDTKNLLKVDSKTGKTYMIASDKQYDVEDALTNPETGNLQAVCFLKERSEWRIIDRSFEDDFRELRNAIKGDIEIMNSSLNNRKWIISSDRDTAPIQYFLYDRTTKKINFLFSKNYELENYIFAPMKPVSFKSRDGKIIHGYLTLPQGVAQKNLPLVIKVHGGPWSRDFWGFNRDVQWLANRGYAVLQINFRGSTGYGKKFLNAGDREWGNRMHDDLIDGKKWAVSQGYANSGKVAIYGGSYGGYASLVGLAFTPDEFVCGVSVVGPSNLVTLFKTIPPYWTSFKLVIDRRVGKVETEEEFLKSRSPLFKADKIKAPLLIAQGSNDPRVKKAESDQIVFAMRKNKKNVMYIVFNDEGHGFVRPENNFRFFAAAEKFLSEYLGGRLEPADKDDDYSNFLN